MGVIAKSVTRVFAKRDVVKDFDLTIGEGEAVALVGPSGCGKTTLLQVMGLLDRPDSGEIVIDDVSAWSLSDVARAHLRLSKIGFVFQQHGLLEQLSVRENIALPAWRRHGTKARAFERADALLESFGLKKRADAMPSVLSGGEAQRVAVARALVNEPRIVLADEPTGSLDSASAEPVVRALLDATKRGASLLLVTHDSDLAARLPRRVQMADGRPSLLPRSSIAP